MIFLSSFSKNTIIILLLFFSNFGYSQSVSILYECNFKPDTLKKEKIVTQNYRLDIYKNESIFRTENRRTSDSLINNTGYGMGYNLNPFFELYVTKDFKNKEFKKVIVLPINRDKFGIEIDEVLQWKILTETAKIDNFNCQKAVVKYGGRDWITWFSKDLPLSDGPYCFHGLPGLIIRLYDETGDYNFNATEIKTTNFNSIFKVKDGLKITWKQFQKIMNDFYNSPYAVIKSKNMKVVTDNENEGYKEINYDDRRKEIQKMLLNYNNPIELNHNIFYQK